MKMWYEAVRHKHEATQVLLAAGPLPLSFDCAQDSYPFDAHHALMLPSLLLELETLLPEEL